MKIVFLLFFFSLNALAQSETETVSTFWNTTDFLNNNSTESLIEIRYSGDAYFITKKIVDSKTKKRTKGSGTPWAIKRGDNYYFNMLYSDDIMSGIFIKLDIIGRYCLDILDKSTFNQVKASAVNKYGYGALGLLANDSISWNKALKDSADNKKYVILIDTRSIEPRDSPRNEGSRGVLLGKRKVSEIMKDNNIEGSAKDLSFEEVIKLIKGENAKSEL